MEAITPLDLEGIKVLMQKRLQQEIGENVTCEVNCLLEQQTILVFIHFSELSLPASSHLLANLASKLSQNALFDGYHLKLYWIIDGGIYPLDARHFLSPRFPPALTSQERALGNYHGLKLPQIGKKLKKRQYRKLSLRLFALGFGIVSGLGVLYLITRPCVMGSCPQLGQAQQAAERALKEIIRESPSHITLNQAKQQLSAAIRTLEAIPPWSAYYAQARELRLDYQDQILPLESLMSAIAITQPHQPEILTRPQSVQQWEQSKLQLEQVIANLPELDQSEPLQSSIEAQKQQYQTYLAKIEQRLQSEQEATQRFQQGLDAGKMAFGRQKMAQTVEDWQLVESTWKTAIQRFQSVTSDTTLYPQARQYLEKYQHELIKTQSKKQTEERADRLSQKAIKQAKEAENWQNKQQFSQAVKQWQNALVSLQQIPENSFYYQQAQPLIANYQVSLNTAKSQLKNAVHRQKIEQYLQKLCYRPETICSYTLEDSLIKVNLTKDYNQKLLQTALEAKQQGNQHIQQNLLNHLSRLEKSLQSISLHTQKTVELYHSDGRLMMTFEPK